MNSIDEDHESVTVMVPRDDLEKFREKAIKKFGYKKGYLKKAANEAILLWIAKEDG